MVIAETLMGVQLVRSAIKGIKDVINTCEDVSEIAHHIDNVFHGEEQVNRRIAAKKKKQQKKGQWYSFIASRLKSDDEGDGTSIQEIAQELIEKKQIEQQRSALAHLLNRRFGADTWTSIMKIRFERIEKRKEQRKIALQKAKEEAWERKRFWKKTGEESGKLLIILGVIVGMYYYISYACKGCI
jgi:hypothetical protein|tara:strand:+ start:30 stop:584 length:555 start_codon:yes stop_codon:yes gene_type:complete